MGKSQMPPKNSLCPNNPKVFESSKVPFKFHYVKDNIYYTICLLVQILGPSQSSEMLPLMFSSNLVWALYSSYIRASVFEF
jgi:hypothetical protein